MRQPPNFPFPIAEEALLAEQMRRVQRGDRGAYQIVLKRSRDAFLDLASRRTATNGSGDDVVERCLRTLHEARHTFNSTGSFSTLILAIGRHHGLTLDGRTRDTWAAWIPAIFRGLGLRARSPEPIAGAGGRVGPTVEDHIVFESA